MPPTINLEHIMRNSDQNMATIPQNFASAIDSATVSLSVVVIGEPKFVLPIENVNGALEEVCGCSTSDVVGYSVTCFQGNLLDGTILDDHTSNINRDINCSDRIKADKAIDSLHVTEEFPRTLSQQSAIDARKIEVMNTRNTKRRWTKSLGCGPMINNLTCNIDIHFQHGRWKKKRNELLSFFMESPSPSKISRSSVCNTIDPQPLTALGSMMTSSTFWDDFISMDQEIENDCLDLTASCSDMISSDEAYETDLLGISSTDLSMSTFPRNIDDASAIAHISLDAIVITESISPYRVTYVNQAWVNLCGYTRDDIVGCTLGCIQGINTQSSTLKLLASNLKMNIDTSLTITNYKKSGEAFENNLRIVPLKNSKNETTHFFGILEERY